MIRKKDKRKLFTFNVFFFFLLRLFFSSSFFSNLFDGIFSGFRSFSFSFYGFLFISFLMRVLNWV